MKMSRRARVLCKLFSAAVVVVIAASACRTETIEVTRIKIMERRVIERVPVTVEVTRIEREVVTPRPATGGPIPTRTSSTPEGSPTPAATPTQSIPPPTPAAPTWTALPDQAQTGQELMTALKNTEQTLLALIQTLNSSPLPVEHSVELYGALSGAPLVTAAETDPQIGSIHIRYREQVDYVLGQMAELYNHLVKIQAGEASQTTVSPIHLGLAQDAVAGATSNVQSLIRELEDTLATQ
jgi:hypothetical protein